jgi:hypothetical protein
MAVRTNVSIKEPISLLLNAREKIVVELSETMQKCKIQNAKQTTNGRGTLCWIYKQSDMPKFFGKGSIQQALDKLLLFATRLLLQNSRVSAHGHSTSDNKSLKNVQFK